MLDKAVRDEAAPDVFWVDLRRLPADLQVRSDASREWSVRTLTLMARAGLIELISLKAAGVNADASAVPAAMPEAVRAAIRLRADGHRNRETFGRVMTSARASVFQAAARAFDSMLAVARGQLEIADALVDMYSVRGIAWVPVTSCCGGCAVHWKARTETVRYEGTMTPRLNWFRPPNLSALEALQLPMQGPNLLVIAVSRTAAFHRTAIEVLKALVPLLSCHTVAMDEQFAKDHGAAVAAAVPRQQRLQTFFDSVSPNDGHNLEGGEGEVRVIVWTAALHQVVWHQLALSRARLEVLIVPAEAAHPLNPARNLIDTTTHVDAASLLQRVYA